MITEALKQAFNACADRAKQAGTNEQDFIQFYKSWDIEPVVIRGAVCGAVMMNGPEMHVAVVESVRRKWATPSLWRKVIDKTLEQYGFAVTSVMEGNTQGVEFVRRVGFVETGRQGGVIAFRLDKK